MKIGWLVVALVVGAELLWLWRMLVADVGRLATDATPTSHRLERYALAAVAVVSVAMLTSASIIAAVMSLGL